MKRARNRGETKSEQDYIRISHLTRLRCAYTILADIAQSADPINIPKEEYQQVMYTVSGWIERLE